MTGPGGRSKLKTLWIVDHYAVPPQVMGFVRQHDHARFIQDHGWNTRIFASSYNHKTHRYERPTALSLPMVDRKEDGIDFTWLHTTPYTSNNWRRYFNLVVFFFVSLLATFGRGRPDVVIGASPHLLAALSGWVIARRFRVPFVLEVQDLWPDSLIQLGLSNRAIVLVLRKIEQFLYTRADAIITLANGITDGVVSVTDAGKVALIPNGASVLESLSVGEREQRRAEHGWEDRWVAMWTGAHGEANHLETIIDAARYVANTGHSDILFVLLGDGPEKPRLRKLAADLPNVQFLDPVPTTEVGAMLQIADVGLIVHSDTQAVRGVRPTKLTEYMGAGLPIISDLQGECENLIASADCGVTVPTMSPHKLAAVVVDASINREQFSERGANGTTFIQATHDRKMLAGKLLRLLDEIVDKKNRA